MKWEDLSLSDLCALYEHSTAYIVAERMSRGSNTTLSEKDRAWYQHWGEVKVKVANIILKRTQSLED